MGNILIACEFSGIVRDAFVESGYDAMSCDLLPTEKAGKHYQGDVFDIISNGWRLIIAHPECTCVCVSGNSTYAMGKQKHNMRVAACEKIEYLWEQCKKHADRVCLENPVGVLSTRTGMGKPQYIQPWQFGHGETKKTGLWLHNLPQLKATNIVSGREQRVWREAPSVDRWRNRSRTLTGVANAMADQWGD